MRKILLGTLLLLSTIGCTQDECPTVTGVDYHMQNGVITTYYLELSDGSKPIVSRDDYFNYNYGDTYCN